MASSGEGMRSIVVVSLVGVIVFACSVKAARESEFFSRDTAAYTDSKQWYPTGTDRGVQNSYNANAYYDANEGQGNRNGYGNGAGQSYRTSENGYGGGEQYFSENQGEGSGYGNGAGYGSNSGYGQGGQYGSGYGKGSNGGYYTNP